MPFFARIVAQVAQATIAITCAVTVGPALMPIGFIGIGCNYVYQVICKKNDNKTYVGNPQSVCIMLAAAPVCFGMFAVSK